MTADQVFDSIVALVGGFVGADGEHYQRAADGFGFDADPRGEVRAFFVEPPVTSTLTEYLAGAGARLSVFSIMLSRARGDDPMVTARDMLVDLRALQQHVEDGIDGDAFVPTGSTSTRVAIPESPSTTVLGELVFGVDHEDD